MTYSVHDFGRQLLDEINRGYDIVRISRWAMATYSEQCMHADETLRAEILKVVAMEEGPQFEYTEEELRDVAIRLTNG